MILSHCLDMMRQLILDSDSNNPLQKASILPNLTILVKKKKKKDLLFLLLLSQNEEGSEGGANYITSF